MAKARIIDLPQMRANFQVSGLVSGVEKNNFYQEKTTKNGGTMRLLNFGTKINNEDDTVYISLTGMPRDNVYFSRRENKEKGITKDTKAVAWADRKTFVPAEGYNMIGIGVAMERKPDANGIERAVRKTMTEFDACETLAAELTDDMPVFARGEIEFSSYNGTHRTRFNMNNLTHTKPIDMSAEGFTPNAKFTCPIIFMGIDKDDAIPGRFIINAKFVTYGSVEDIELCTYNENLAKTMRKSLKPYTYIEVWGAINIVKSVVVEENGDIWGESNAMRPTVTAPTMRELAVTGADSSTIDKETYNEVAVEEAIAKIKAKDQATADYTGKQSWGTSKEPDVEFAGADEEPW